MTLYLVPLKFDEANELVRRWHRHHQPPNTFRFAIGVFDSDGAPHGAVIVGPPVARLAGHPRAVAEVTRLVTDGTKNACSMLYAASARAAQAMGFERIQTYILDSEPGTSLRASGWTDEGIAGGGDWFRESRNSQTTKEPSLKHRWAKSLNAKRPSLHINVDDEAGSETIWGDAA